MKPIGGFFDLELPEGGVGYHSDALGLTTGRACLALFVREERPARCLLPFYCCDALWQPFVEAGIPVQFYAVDERLDPIDPPDLEPGEWLLYTNFFGLKGATVSALTDRYGERLVVDDTHAFFRRGYTGLWSFTSARKIFGVPDGAYAYRPEGRAEDALDLPRNNAVTIDHLIARVTGHASEALTLYRESEARFNCSLLRLSALSERLLAGVDYESAKAKRCENFAFLAKALNPINAFAPATRDSVTDNVPFCYPLLTDPVIPAEDYHARGFFVASLWLDTTRRADTGFALERRLSRDLRPLPIDHRYGPEDLQRIVDFVQDVAR